MKESLAQLPSPQSMSREVFKCDNSGSLYPDDLVRDSIAGALVNALNIPAEQVPPLGIPPAEIKADFSLPVFTLAKVLRKNPAVIASDLATKLVLPPMIAESQAAGPYLNFSLDYGKYGQEILSQILRRKESYGAENLGHGEVVVIDMSSPNIAKPMGVGHLRSTVIGHSLARILEFTGFKAVKDNHLGDWGTQFGMLLKAYELWGNETPELLEDGKEVDGLMKLYVRIHDEVERTKKEAIESMRQKVKSEGLDAIEGLRTAYETAYSGTGSADTALDEALSALAPETELEKAGRMWFRKLESGDAEAKKQWQWVTRLSMKEFDNVYRLLGVDFDYALGESFYQPVLGKVVEMVREQPFAVDDKGALIADLGEKLGRMVVQASDGRSLYVTRDLACAIWRSEILNSGRILYVVGADQKHYFTQWFEILRRLGYPVADHCQHVYFGMISLPEGKMSTRRGRVVFLKDVIEKGMEKAKEAIKEKNPSLFKNPEKTAETARMIAVGAIIWSDLGKDMRRDIVFNWDEILSFDGYSAPYVQYVHARGRSILRKAGEEGITVGNGETVVEMEEEKALVKLLSGFPHAVKVSSETYNPAIIAEYVHSLAQCFNRFYKKCSVMNESDPNKKASRLRMVEATTQVIKNALYLLGIEAPEEM